MTSDRVEGYDTFPLAILRWADTLVEELAREPLFQHAAVFTYDSRRNGLVLAAQRWATHEDTGEVRTGSWIVPIEGSVCGRVFRTGQAVLLGDVFTEPEYREFPGGESRSELAVPIVVGGRPVGVVNLESPRIAAFSIEDLDRVRAIADAAADTFDAQRFGELVGVPIAS
jgi:GAF domain-containing protein